VRSTDIDLNSQDFHVFLLCLSHPLYFFADQRREETDFSRIKVTRLSPLPAVSHSPEGLFVISASIEMFDEEAAHRSLVFFPFVQLMREALYAASVPG